ncbi:MAG: hypothetical protein AAF673_04975 [Pseudomonadota bacterium]
MAKKQNNFKSEIIFYESQDGKVSVAVRFEDDNIWLTQKQMSELFECTTDNISLHLKHIYKGGELNREATTEEYSVVQKEGKRSVKRTALFYNLLLTYRRLQEDGYL